MNCFSFNSSNKDPISVMITLHEDDIDDKGGMRGDNDNEH